MSMEFRTVQDDKIRRLAETLKQNGLAASESEAIRMATSMTNTESKVNQHYDQNRTHATMNTKGAEARAQERESQRSNETQQQPQQTSTQVQPEQISREEEVKAQEQPPREAPVPTHSNGAIADAIQAVQNSFENRERREQTIETENPSPKEAPRQVVERSLADQTHNGEEIPRSSDPVLEEKNISAMNRPVQQAPSKAPEPTSNESAESETTKEVFDRPPQQQRRQQKEEEKVDLGSIFDFSKR